MLRGEEPAAPVPPAADLPDVVQRTLEIEEERREELNNQIDLHKNYAATLNARIADLDKECARLAEEVKTLGTGIIADDPEFSVAWAALPEPIRQMQRYAIMEAYGKFLSGRPPGNKGVGRKG